jgi:aspartate aminotransferase
LLTPAVGFGCAGYVRIAYCVSKETIQNALPYFKQLAQYYGVIK